MMPYTDSFMKALALFPIKVSKYPPLKTPDSRRCITSDPISLLRFVYLHIPIRILTLLSSLYMMKAVPTGFLFHQLKIIWSFQLCEFCVQWNLLLPISSGSNPSKLPLTTSASCLLRVSLVGKNLFITPTDLLSHIDRYSYAAATNPSILSE